MSEEESSEGIADEMTTASSEELSTEEETTEEFLENSISSMGVSLDDLDYPGEIHDGTLYIQSWGMSEKGVDFTAENIQTILEAQYGNFAGDLFIDYPNDGYITAGVWNAAKALAASEGYVHFSVAPEGEPEQMWMFRGLSTASEQTKIAVTCTAGESGEGWTFTLDNVSFKAQYADLNLGVDSYSSERQEIYAAYKEAIFGKGNEALSSLVLVDKDGNIVEGNGVGPSSGEDYYNISVFEINKLTKSVPYTIKMMPYAGEEWSYNGRTYVEFSTMHMDDKDEFTEAELISLLEAKGNKKYDGIQITIENDSENSNVWLYSSVVAEAAKHIKEDGYLELYCNSNEDCEMNIIIWEPSTTQTFENQICKADVSVKEGKGFVCVNLPNINADRVWIQNSYNSNDEIYDSFIGAYGEEKRNYKFVSNDTSISGVNGTSLIRYGRLQISFGDALKLENNTEYEIRDAVYHGVVSEDGSTLTIDYSELEKIEEKWTVDRIAEIIKKYDRKFESIEIVLPGESCSDVTVYSQIYNAAVGRLSDNNYGIHYINVMADCRIKYHFANPSEVKLSRDVHIKNEMYINEYDRPALKYDFPEALRNVYTNVYMELSLEDEITQKYMERLDDGTQNGRYGLYPTEVARMSLGWEALYEDDSYENQIGIEASLIGMNFLKTGKEYVVNPWLIGHTWEEEWDEDTGTVRILEINANEYGYESFSEKLLNEYLEEWKWAVESEEDGPYYKTPFNIINIKQSATDKNMIYKDSFNLARTLLADEGYTEIKFIFDSSVSEQVEGKEEWNWYQNQMSWSFNNPSKATTDMKVNLDITPKGEDGLKLKVSKNAYPTSGVNVNYSVDADLTMAKLFNETIGDPAGPEENSNHIGIITNVDKLTLSKSDAWYGSYVNGEDKEVMSFSINNVQNLPETQCTAVPICQAGEFYIGQKELKMTQNQVEKPGTKVTWKSFDTNIGSFSGSTLTLLNEGKFRYAATFQNANGVQVAEIFEANVTTRLLDIDFVNVEKTISGNNILKMEMNSSDWKYKNEGKTEIDDDWYPRAYLDLRFYPDRAGIEPSRLEWSVIGDEGVVELLNNYEYDGNYYPNGEIKALEPGEVIVRVRCKDEENNYLTDEKGTPIFAECKVIVEPSVWDEINWETAFNDVPTVAITNFDKTLADVKLPAEFEWKVPSTSLSAFANVGRYAFPAVYTSPNDGRTVEVMLDVTFIKIESITLGGRVQVEIDGELRWIDLEQGAVIGEGTVLDFGYSLNVWNGYEIWPEGPVLEDVNELLKVKGKNIELSLEYDKKITVDGNGLHFIVPSDAKGEKTFKVSLMQKDTSKANAKPKELATGSYTVIVSQKPVANFGEMYIGKAIDESAKAFSGMIGEKGIFYFGLPKDSGYKLTVKNLNTGVSKWGRITYKDMVPDEGQGNTDITYYVACVPYEIIGEGNVAYSLTANDEVKTSVSRTEAVYYRDYLPRMQATKLTIDKNRENAIAELPIQMDLDTYFGDSNDTEKEIRTDKFNLNFVNTDGQERVVVSFKEGVNVKKGTYKFSVNVPVTTPLEDEQSDSGKKVITWPVQLTVTVTDKLPTLIVDQKEKVNLFYTDEEGDGVFTITANADITNVKLEPQKDGADLDYTLELQEDGTYTVKLIPGRKGSNKKATIVASFAGYTQEVKKKVTISVVNKAPTLVLSSKSDTYYTGYSRGDDLNTYLTFMDKSTGEMFSAISGVAVSVGSKKEELPSNQGPLFSFKSKSNKNTYRLGKDERGISIVLDNAQNVVKATDKFTFYIEEANWAKAIKVEYKIKVDTTIPKLELSSKSVTINKNDAFFAQQVGVVKLNLKGSNRDVSTGDYWVNFSGTDTKSNKYLNTDLILEYHNGNVRVRLNKNTVPRGTYKYNVKLSAKGLPDLTTQLTVKVIDEAPAKCITVSGKGTIDVLDRNGTSVVYSAKLKNVQGAIAYAEIRGTDANMFYSEYKDGKLIVKAYERTDYSTKHTYKITPVFYVRGDDFGEFELKGKEQSIKVKQGKPKLSLTAHIGNILYRNRDNQVVMNVDALLNKKQNVKVTSIEPLNYWDTFNYIAIPDENGDIHEMVIEESDYPQEIIATGKTVTLQFNVRYEGMAVNEKPIKATFKMIVK